MKTYNIALLKSKLSKILSEVIDGEEILVTDHNKPVAKIVSQNGLNRLPKQFDVKHFLSMSAARLKPGAVPSVELIRKIRDGE